jgi:4-hydroxyphenylacetate 3-monooxygenase oxygenase component
VPVAEMNKMVPEVTSSARGAMTGERFIESLRDGREVWYDGERVDVTTHPAFQGTIREMARLYDLQSTEQYRDVMTVESPETGNRISYSYMLPRSLGDLRLKRRNSEGWFKESFGQIGRAPDFMSNVCVGLYNFRAELEKNDPRFGKHAVDYYRYCAENDLALTHALGDPQIDRSSNVVDEPDLGLRIVRETEDGIVVRGAKQLATLAPISNEVLSYLSATFALRGAREFVLWFALPMNTPGLKTLCRHSLEWTMDGHAHPFASRYDEQDSMLFFDDVVIPWERVFLLYDGPLALRGLGQITPWSSYSSLCRLWYRWRTFVGVTTMIAEAIGVDGFREIRDLLGEQIMYTEVLRLGLSGMEANGAMTPGGLFSPAPGQSLGIFGAQFSGRVVEILRKIGASGIIMQPSERDLVQPELRPFLQRYMRGRNIAVDQKSRLFRLAWDLAADGFGTRQEIYEYWHRGDITRNKTNLYLGYDRRDIVDQLSELIAAPLHRRENNGMVASDDPSG